MKTLRCWSLAMLLLGVLSGRAPAVDIWQPVVLTGLWGELGLGYQVKYSASGESAEWQSGFERSLQASLTGFVLHPRFLLWQGDLGLDLQPADRNYNASFRLDFLPEHSTPVTLSGQWATGQVEKEFEPLREVITKSLDGLALVGAFGDPLILTWSKTDTEVVDPANPSHHLVERSRASYKNKVTRNHDFEGKYDLVQVDDLLREEDLQRETVILRLKSRFLYDLVSLDSTYASNKDSGVRSEESAQISEELKLSHRKNWDSVLRLSASNLTVEGEPQEKLSGSVETAWRWENGWRLSVGGSEQYRAVPGLEHWGTRAFTGIGWGGELGAYKAQAYWRYSAGPERSQGGRYMWMHAEELMLSDQPRPLSEPEVDLAEIRVYRPNDMFSLVLGRDYRVEVIGTRTYICRQYPNGEPDEQVLVDYRYFVRPRDFDKTESSLGANLTALAPRMILSFGADSSVVREDGRDRVDEVRDDSCSASYTFVEGRVKMNANILERDGIRHRQASIQFAPGRWTLSETITRDSSAYWERSVELAKAAYKLAGNQALRLDAVIEDRTGRSSGATETEEKALQAGLTFAWAPNNRLFVDGGLRYLRDWIRPAYDQLALETSADWRRGQLALRLDFDWKGDIGRDRSEGKLGVSAVRYF